MLYGIACVLTMGTVYKIEAESEEDARRIAAKKLENDNLCNFDLIDTRFTVLGTKEQKENDNGT